MTYKFLLLLLVTSTILMSCYRMPTDDDYSLIPSTNHPEYTKDQGRFMPTAAY